LELQRKNDGIVINGQNIKAEFNSSTGMLNSLQLNGKEIIYKGKGLALNWYRSINNDQREYTDPNFKLNSFTYELNKSAGNISVKADMVATLSNVRTSTIPYTVQYTFYSNGAMDVDVSIDNTLDEVKIPRLGLQLSIVPGIENVEWYGRGPQENYADRKASAYFGVYQNSVKGMEERYVRSQSMGNREDLRWLKMTDGKEGFKIIAKDKMNFTALHFYDKDLWTLRHLYNLDDNRLPETILSLDYMQRGLGNASCGPGPMNKYELPVSKNNTFSFRIEPIIKQ
jgi:beta-galactosidase